MIKVLIIESDTGAERSYRMTTEELATLLLVKELYNGYGEFKVCDSYVQLGMSDEFVVVVFVEKLGEVN